MHGHGLAGRSLVLLAVVVLGRAGAVRASVPEMVGTGPRSASLAGTGAADADGYDATYANPAGLVEWSRRRLTLGYIHGSTWVQMDGRDASPDATNMVIVGASLPLPFGGVLARRIALGLAFFLPTGLLNRARSPYPDEPRLALIDSRTQVVTLSAGAGVRLTDRVTVGVGLIVLAALAGEIRIAPDAAGRISTVSEQQLIASFAGVAGVRVRAHRTLRLGAVLRGESMSRYDLRISNSLGAALPIQLPTLRVAGVSQYDPMQAALEASWRPLPWLGVVGGVTWKHWSAYPLPAENATPGAAPLMEPGFHDTAVPRIAVELERSFGRLSLAGRAGYFFEWSPAPREGTLRDADRHVITGGAGLSWSGRLVSVGCDLFVQWHQLAGSPHVSGGFLMAGVALGLDL